MSSSIFSNAIYLDDVPQDQWKNYIGLGYRYVSYTTDANRQGRIVLFGYDTAGNPAIFILPWKSWVKYTVKYETNERDIYDRYVATKYFSNSFERKKWVEAAVGIDIVECFRPEQEALQFLFAENALDDNFNTYPLRIQYFDIETEISDQFEKPADARNRINMMTIYDSQTEKFYTWSLEHAEIDFKEEPLKDYPKDKFVFFEFHNNEQRMLEHFLDWYEDNYPDVNYGWNTKAYDIPYLVRRIENVLGNTEAKRLSPVGKYFIKDVNHDNKRTDASAQIEVNIDGLFIADGLALYRDKFGIAKPDGGYTLDNIGEYEGCGHKIHYEGTLKDLYLKDYQKFYEYNVRDVDLAKRIDDKCKMIKLARTITSFGLSQYPTIYSSISYLVGSVTAFAKTQMGRVFTSYLKEEKKLSGFEGAFVFPMQKGLKKKGIAAIDFASLYPSNIRSINASPETYRGKVLVQFYNDDGSLAPINENNELPFDLFNDKVAKAKNVAKILLKNPNGKRTECDVDKLRAWIIKHGIYTANNTIFLKHEEKWGVIAKWCEHFYNERKATKKKMLAIFHELHDTSKHFTPEEIAEKEEKEGNFNSRQGALKNMINSIYGQLGSSFSPIANLDIAQSITRQGRMCNINASRFILKRFKEIYDPNLEGYSIYPLDADDPRCKQIGKIDVIALGGDTDSQFVDITCVTDFLIKKYNLPQKIKDWPQEKRQELWDIMFKFTEDEVNKYVRDMVHNYCKTNEQNVLTYELEYMCDVGIYESKKHYYVHKIFEEGDAVDKIKVTGIALKKGETDKAMKNFLSEIYAGVVLKDWTENDYRDYIVDLYEKFKTYSIDEVSFWKGYGTERESVGFLQMAKGATGISKACTYYNHIIKKLGLGKKYDELRVGDKTRFCYIKDTNEYGIDQIAYKPGQWPKEFDKIFEVDYSKMFNKIILDQIKRMREACGFGDVDPRKQVVQDIFEL